MLPYKHPLTFERGALTATAAISATGAAKEGDGSTSVAGAGQITAVHAVLGDSGTLVVRDTDSSGAVILSLLGIPNTRISEYLPPEQWRAFASGFHVTVGGRVNGAIFDMFRPS